jgi:hypothetical protein
MPLSFEIAIIAHVTISTRSEEKGVATARGSQSCRVDLENRAVNHQSAASTTMTSQASKRNQSRRNKH